MAAKTIAAKTMAAKLITAMFVMSSLVGAYVLGRQGQPALSTELGSIESFREALRLTDTVQRTYRLNSFLVKLGPDDVEAAAEMIEERKLWLAEGELRNFMIAWTSFDGPAALAWADSRSRPFARDASADAMYGWAFHDSASARTALEKLETSRRTPAITAGFVAGWLQSGKLDGVIEYIAEQQDDLTRQKYTNLLTIELIREGPDGVVRWAEAIGNDAHRGYKRVAFQKAGNIIASVDPVFAARWIEGHLAEP